MSRTPSRGGFGFGLGLGLVGRVWGVVVGLRFGGFEWVRMIKSGDRVTGG